MNRNDILFSEYYAAAQSLKNAWTRLASTYGGIIISLTKESLIIKPILLIRWLTVLLHLDLCHDIPITKIIGIREMGKWLSYGKLELTFQTGNGRDQKVLLYMKKYPEFVQKVHGLMDKQ